MTVRWDRVVAWLLAHGWVQKAVRGGHAQWEHPPTGVKVTLSAHVVESKPWELASVQRGIVRAGFSRREFRDALEGR